MSSHDAHPAGRFTTTQWSLVLAAADSQAPDAREALATLCRQYWRPIYSFVRQRGADSERALDLTQGFFSTLLEKGYVKQADQERGRFRTFLLTSVRNYMANEWDRSQALKRGGGAPHLSLDAGEAEQAYRLEPVDGLTPEKIFDRRWARTLLNTTFARLRDETPGGAGRRRFDDLAPCLSGQVPGGYAELARNLGMSQAAVKVAVHRLRRRFRSVLRDEVARTVGDPGQVDDELRHLMAIVS